MCASTSTSAPAQLRVPLSHMKSIAVGAHGLGASSRLPTRAPDPRAPLQCQEAHPLTGQSAGRWAAGFGGSACDYLDVADAKGLRWGFDLRCVADQDRDQAVLR